MQNLYGFILTGLTSIFNNALAGFPNAQPSATIFAQLPSALTSVLTPVVNILSPFLDLRVIMVVATIVALLELARAVLAIYRTILKLIPAAS